jgi:hypothetical protein
LPRPETPKRNRGGASAPIMVAHASDLQQDPHFSAGALELLR